MIPNKIKKTLSSKCRHRIELQSKTEFTDHAGGFAEQWATAKTIWAAVDSLSKTWMAEYRTRHPSATHLVTIRGEIDLSAFDRFKFGGRYFDDLRIDNLEERSFEKRITCREVSR
jgi:head-tail adaptor